MLAPVPVPLPGLPPAPLPELPTPQTLEMPLPPQVWPEGQLPHWSVFPQPSPTGPQLARSCSQLDGTQPFPVVVPELDVDVVPLDELDVLVPPLELDVLVLSVVHTLFVQTWFGAQEPQLIMPPQPSDADPQLSPAGQALFGAQVPPQRLGLPFGPPPQV